MKILITSGGTKVPIDSVRHIGNMSSGTMGREIAMMALAKGHEVDFFTSKDGKRPSQKTVDFTKSLDIQLREVQLIASILREALFHEYEYVSYDDYLAGVMDLLDKKVYDAIILCAAVSDYRMEPVKGKISSNNDELSIVLQKAQKVLPLVRNKAKASKVVGFKLLSGSTTEELIRVCYAQFNDNNLDMVVGNDIDSLRSGNYFQIHIVKDDFSPTGSKLLTIREGFGYSIISSLEEMVR